MCTTCFWNKLRHVRSSQMIGKPNNLSIGRKKTKGPKQDGQNRLRLNLEYFIHNPVQTNLSDTPKYVEYEAQMFIS